MAKINLMIIESSELFVGLELSTLLAAAAVLAAVFLQVGLCITLSVQKS